MLTLKEAERRCSSLNTVKTNVLIRLSGCGASRARAAAVNAHCCLTLWLADLLKRRRLFTVDVIDLIIGDLSPDLKQYGSQLDTLLAATPEPDFKEVPTLFLGVIESRYVTFADADWYLDTDIGERVPKDSIDPFLNLEMITYNLAVLFMRQFSRPTLAEEEAQNAYDEHDGETEAAAGVDES